jgi:nitroreductase
VKYTFGSEVKGYQEPAHPAISVKKWMNHFILAYAELYAPSMGLGTCITGFFNGCAASGYKPLLDILNLPENMHVTGGLMVGYPKYTYRRLADRNPLQIYWQ